EYARLFFPERLLSRDSLDKAYNERSTGRYEVCLFQASKAIAGTNTILGLLGVKEDMVPEILSDKLDAAKESIIRQTEKGLFPMAGYSYYEYASSLKSTDVYSALLYSEYSLEMSNLDIYFERKPGIFEALWRRVDEKIWFIAFFAGGILIGLSITFFISRHARKKKCIIVRKKL
ncbi:MAG: hypothetical protein V1702_04110, partial [Candidatus Woesearchaeota archaeon]